HMQDLADDYRTIDRVYLPQDAMAAGGIDVTALAAPASSSGLRRAIDLTLDRTAELLVEARRLPGLTRDRRLRWESAAIVALAEPVRRYGLRREDFFAVIDGMQMDAERDIRAPSLDELDLYCDRVASAVGRLSVRAFGSTEPRADDVASSLGRALQLTNILR